MGSWREVRSLLRLLWQVDAMAPNRSRASDGTIGDAAHQARTSDHNPRVVPALGTTPVVLALDITHDPARGCDTHALAEDIRVSRDRRVLYVIANRQVTGPNHGWRWDPYTGTDPHINHMHVSVLATVLADDITDWAIEGDTVAISDDEINRIVNAIFNRQVNGVRLADIVGREQGTNVDLPGQLAALSEKLAELPAGGGLSPEDRAAISDLSEQVAKLRAGLVAVAAALA
jgi:hypothetical protein